MSHHYSRDNWVELMLNSLRARLPKRYGVYLWQIKPSQVIVTVYKPFNDKIRIGKDVEAAISWPHCSPYTAANILLYKWAHK